MIFTTSIVVLILVILVYFVSHTILIPEPLPRIPYNRISSLLPTGELIPLGIHQFCTGEVFSWLSLRCLQLRSPIVQLFIPPFSTTHPVIVLSDLREIEDIVTKRMHEIDRADMMHDWFEFLVPRATIGMKTDAKWKEQRRLWNVVLSPRFLEEVAVVCFQDVGCRLVDLWENKSILAGERAFDAGDDIKIATLGGIWKMAVGSDLGLFDSSGKSLQVRRVRTKTGIIEFGRTKPHGFYMSLRTMLTCLDWVTQGISPRMYKWIFRHAPWFMRAERVKNSILGHMITITRNDLKVIKKESVQGKATLGCALQEVLKKDIEMSSTRRHEIEAASDAALRDELLELLITGHETTASSISWALKYLTDNPKVQTRLRKSLFNAFPNATPANPPSAEALATASLPYLDAVIAEVLRYSNTGPVSFRQTMKECNILGYTVPAGTPLILVTAGPYYDSPNRPLVDETARSPTSQAKHRQEQCAIRTSHNASVFMPERWLKEDGSFQADANHSLPFSAGPRGCFGKKIALLEMRILLSTLMMRFEFPQLSEYLSKYGARDGLTRRPTSCFVRPVILNVE